jgi:hypothetical protein
MSMRYHVDPRGGRLPALEKNILKFRALEMTLLLFHSERLQQEILDAVQGYDAIVAKLRNDPNHRQRVPEGTKDAQKKCRAALVADGIFSADEAAEIKAIVDFRNNVAHSIHKLTADIGTSQVARDHMRYRGAGEPSYDYKALARVRELRAALSERTSSRIQTLDFAPLLFEAAETTLDEELARLRRKIDKQMSVRRRENAALQSELSVADTELVEWKHPSHPLAKYDDGRLTARGQEICYRLFDLDRSPMAVAIMMRISLRSAKARHRGWIAAGSKDRTRPDFDSLPHRRFYRRNED